MNLTVNTVVGSIRNLVKGRMFTVISELFLFYKDPMDWQVVIYLSFLCPFGNVFWRICYSRNT